MQHDSRTIARTARWQWIIGCAVGVALDIALWIWMSGSPFITHTRAERHYDDNIHVGDIDPHIYRGLGAVLAVALVGGLLGRAGRTRAVGEPIFVFGLLGSFVLGGLILLAAGLDIPLSEM
ncbi:hypothetical protein Cs7R123_52930 [Catellatospora sp. TT07R-123]|uniref:hypothetical protein n=1 Tax=Catellatospora sp. TT07R-123 TaxID=2733863 RepID=UPI001B2F6F4C|nr:hypothetical protein [Catellatospora sp. TT07R-123]GHJ47951.1 hypothetical protein Cs7R123_52930 [Catellatospora sp. TT07R-123]